MRRGGAGKKRDDAEPAIIQALRQMQCCVVQLHGPGVPDLLVWHPRLGYMVMEVKTGKGSLLRPSQQELARQMPIHVVRSVDDALAVCAAYVRR